MIKKILLASLVTLMFGCKSLPDLSLDLSGKTSQQQNSNQTVVIGAPTPSPSASPTASPSP